MAKKRTTKKKVKLSTASNISNQMHNSFADIVTRHQTNFTRKQITSIETVQQNLRYELISNNRNLLAQAYVEIGLIQTIVNVPVDDALRGGVSISSKQLDEDDIQELAAWIDHEGDMQNMASALKWTRLFGGGGLIINTDQEPNRKLEIKSVKKGGKLSFIPVDMWELYNNIQTAEGNSLKLGYEKEEGSYRYYGENIHNTRVIVMKGMEAPSYIRAQLRGWGFSSVETLIRSINQYLKSTDLAFEVLDEFKIDVFRLHGLAESLFIKGGEEKIATRVETANREKNFRNAITLDAQDEYQQKQLSFSGLAETMKEIRMQVAADMRMPITKLFGISSTGFNSGEDDIETYNAMIESTVRAQAKYHILRVIELRCQQLFGFVPDDLEVDFEPLRYMSSEQEEIVKTAKFDRLIRSRELGEIDSKEFREACNRDNLLEIQLETDNTMIGDDYDSEMATGDDDGDGEE